MKICKQVGGAYKKHYHGKNCIFIADPLPFVLQVSSIEGETN